MVIQFLTGRISPNQYVHKIGVSESQDCTYGEGVQSPRHILLKHRMLVSLCNERWKNVRQKVRRMRLDFDTLASEPFD